MPRQARMDVPGALHRIMVRGINTVAIPANHEDKARFLERLGEYSAAGDSAIYARVLMKKHAISRISAMSIVKRGLFDHLRGYGAPIFLPKLTETWREDD
jgi:hypothetical protein